MAKKSKAPKEKKKKKAPPRKKQPAKGRLTLKMLESRFKAELKTMKRR